MLKQKELEMQYKEKELDHKLKMLKKEPKSK
jgi:hypothetical protein